MITLSHKVRGCQAVEIFLAFRSRGDGDDGDANFCPRPGQREKGLDVALKEESDKMRPEPPFDTR
jgi:hypothetical protein